MSKKCMKYSTKKFSRRNDVKIFNTTIINILASIQTLSEFFPLF